MEGLQPLVQGDLIALHHCVHRDCEVLAESRLDSDRRPDVSLRRHG
jgi:hypothetical protein